MPTALAGSEPFIERTQKGKKTIYRGRFSGFNRRSAESACKQLKCRQFECIAMQNEALMERAFTRGGYLDHTASVAEPF